MTIFKKELLAGVSVAALMASPAYAGNFGGVSLNNPWYTSLFGGVAIPDEIETKTDYATSSTTYDVDISLDTGFILGAALGTNITDRFRAEAEFTYQRNDADSFDYGPVGGSQSPFDASGAIDTYSLMGNIWYDIGTYTAHGITPYIGGGIGVAFVDADVPYATSPGFGPDDMDIGFAYQIGAGFNWGITDRLSLDAGYRLKGISGVEFENVTTGGATDYDTFDYFSHNILVGVRWAL